MRMATDQIPAVLTDFLDQVLIPKSSSSTQTFMSALVVGMAGQRIRRAVESSGLADADGTIDLDELKQVATDAIRKSGSVDIPALGYRADTDDIERLFQIAKQHGR